MMQDIKELVIQKLNDYSGNKPLIFGNECGTIWIGKDEYAMVIDTDSGITYAQDYEDLEFCYETWKTNLDELFTVWIEPLDGKSETICLFEIRKEV